MAATAPIDLSYYHRTDALLDAFIRLSSRCGQRLSIDNLRDAEDPSFQLRMATFTDSHSRIAQEPSGEAHVLINFGAHGRELITSEVALQLARMLCGEAPSRFAGSPEESRTRIGALLRRVVVKLVPVQVPYSRRLAEVGSGNCKQRRLNRNGVDVNRNWDVAWAEGHSGQGSSQYRGPRAFSEPETRALARFAGDWRPDVFVDVRSGDRYMAMPYASRASGPADRADRTAMRDTLKSVSAMLSRQHPKLMKLGDLPYGPASSLGEEPYQATGTSLDYMYSKVGVRRAFMWEVCAYMHYIYAYMQTHAYTHTHEALMWEVHIDSHVTCPYVEGVRHKHGLWASRPRRACYRPPTDVSAAPAGSPVGDRPELVGDRTKLVGLASPSDRPRNSTPCGSSQAKPSAAQSSQAKPSQAKPCQVRPSQVKPGWGPGAELRGDRVRSELR